MTCNDNIRDIRVVSLLPHVPTLHLFDFSLSVCVCMYLFVARVCNVSTLLVYFVSMCVWGCNHYVVRAVSQWIFWERFPTSAIHHSESKSGQEHEFVCPVVTCFFSTGIFGLINFRGQIHQILMIHWFPYTDPLFLGHGWSRRFQAHAIFLTCKALSTVNLSLLRLSRLVRVLRAARVFISVPEFYLLLTGLFSSMKDSMGTGREGETKRGNLF